jgi:CheY-like chemotaxis protein
MYLPRHRAPDQPPADLHMESVEKGHGERILVVEDDEGVRGYISEVLQDLNYRVVTAPDAAVALHILERQEQPVDLLLTDVVLPGMNGRQLADSVKPDHPAMRVLFMTGYSRNAIVHQGRLDAGVSLIQKPLSAASLAMKIREVLAGQ